MFKRVRLQLTAWYTLILVLTFVLAGVVFYASAHWLLSSQLDSSLQRTAGQESALWLHEHGHQSDRDRNSDLGAFDYREASFLVVTSTTGQVLYRTVQTPASTLPVTPLVKQAVASNQAVTSTTHTSNGSLRVYTLPVTSGGQLLAVVQVAEPLNYIQHFLRTILLLLFLAGLAITLLAAFGGYWLAGRTLSPIRESMEIQRQFVMNASHELRTPLAAVRAVFDSALRAREGLPDTVQEHLKAGLEQTDRMAELVHRLLVLARYNSQPAPGREPVDLGEVVSDTAANYSLLASQHQLELHVETEDIKVLGHPDLLKDLVSALVDNAVKYGKSRVDVHLERHRHQARLIVTDDGPGVPENDLPHIFDRFYRVDKSRSTDGFGLGLAMVRQVVQAHGGHLEAHNQSGGFSVVVTLPVETP